MTIATKKLKMAMTALNITQADLGARVKQTQANLSKKFVMDNFRINEYVTLVEALGCKVDIIITLPDGTTL